jgi:hypothetical protein
MVMSNTRQTIQQSLDDTLAAHAREMVFVAEWGIDYDICSPDDLLSGPARAAARMIDRLTTGPAKRRPVIAAVFASAFDGDPRPLKSIPAASDFLDAVLQDLEMQGWEPLWERRPTLRAEKRRRAAAAVWPLIADLALSSLTAEGLRAKAALRRFRDLVHERNCYPSGRPCDGDDRVFAVRMPKCDCEVSAGDVAAGYQLLAEAVGGEPADPAAAERRLIERELGRDERTRPDAREHAMAALLILINHDFDLEWTSASVETRSLAAEYAA